MLDQSSNDQLSDVFFLQAGCSSLFQPCFGPKALNCPLESLFVQNPKFSFQKLAGFWSQFSMKNAKSHDMMWPVRANTDCSHFSRTRVREKLHESHIRLKVVTAAFNSSSPKAK